MQNLVAANDNWSAVIDPLFALRAVRAATVRKLYHLSENGDRRIFLALQIGRVASAGARPRLSLGLTESRRCSIPF